MSNITVDTEEILWTLNNEKARLFASVFVFLGILMVAGTFGNIMVLYFYGWKTKMSPSTSFIIALAVFDLISCLIAMPMETADLRYYFNFKSLIACRALRFVSHFASISSGITLVVIAVDRYRRICHPFDRQLNNKHVKVICVIVGILSAILSWPAIVFNQIVDVDVPNSYNVTIIGKDCTTTKDSDFKAYVFVTNVVYVAAFIVITIVLAVLYTFIGRQLYRHQQFRFYVSKRSTKSTRTTANTTLLPSATSNDTIASRDRSHMTASSDHVFEDPPDASDSVVDMREFVTRGLTQVESDRPSSGLTAVTGTTVMTGLTGISGRSKRSIKSVTICEPAVRQFSSIEDDILHVQPYDSEMASWQSNRQHMSSPSSFATFSSRPSSAALSMSEYSEAADGFKDDPDELDKEIEIQKRRMRMKYFRGLRREMTHISEEMYEREETNEIGTNSRADEDLDRGRHTSNSANIHRSPPIQEECDDNDEIADKRVNFPLEHNDKRTDKHEHSMIIDENNQELNEPDNNLDIQNTVIQKNTDTEIGYDEVDSKIRPLSRSSDTSKRSMLSSISRRSNVVSPDSGSNITTTTSVASRASTIRRFKSFLRYNPKSNKMETNTDNVKDLRMKMLDLNTMKYTIIMLIITIVFVISFLPYLSLVGWRYFKDEHEVNILNDLELVLFQIGIRSIFLNSALNPIIYGGFNSTFRAFFYRLCCKCCIRKKRRKRKQQARDQSDSTSGT